MSLEDVINEINIETERKSSQIIQEGKNQAKEMLDKTKEKISKSREKTVKKTNEILSSMEKTELASLKLSMKKQSLNAKKEVVDEVFNEAKQSLNRISQKEYEKILKKLLLKGKKEVDAEYFYCRTKDKKLVSGLSGLKFKDSIDCIGGFVLENSEGTIRSDQTFDVILEKVKEKNISEISLRVFGE